MTEDGQRAVRDRSFRRRPLIAVVAVCFAIGMAMGWSGDRAEAVPAFGHYPNGNGMAAMSADSLSPGTVFLSMVHCYHHIGTGERMVDVLLDVSTAIRNSSRGSAQLPTSKYPLGINLSVYCDNEAFPPWNYANRADALATRNVDSPGGYFDSHPFWSGYIFWDSNRENFRQSNGSYIGGRMHTRYAQRAWCTSMGYETPCGVRNVNQMNFEKYKNRTHDAAATHFFHELIHFFNLNDCEVPRPSVTANSICRSPYVDGLDWRDGYNAADRQAIYDIYSQSWNRGSTHSCARAGIGFAGLRYQTSPGRYRTFYKIGAGHEWLSNHGMDNRATEILPDWRCTVTVCDVRPGVGCWDRFPPVNVWLPLNNYPTNLYRTISYIEVS